MKVNVFVRYGNDKNYINVETLTKEQKERTCYLLNKQAAERIVIHKSS